MYPDLYKWLNLKPEDVTAYDSPFISFDGKVVIPKGQIRLPMQANSKVVEVDFIVVDAYSPYIAILKEYLSQPPVMSRLENDEILFAYIVVASHVISLVLVRVDNGVQRLVYYMSKSLHEAEIRYLPLKKAILAVVHTTRAFDIKYMPRTSVKGQVLADLVAEFAEPSVYVDGAANQRGLEVELVIVSPEMIVIEKSLRLSFSATNNKAEYEGILVGMAAVQKVGGKTVQMFLESKLIVGQVEGELEARDSRMQEYLNQARHLQSNFESFTLVQVPRSRNTHADFLATLVTSSM
ncbi:uncharacterized protein LOC142624969 [Castanea sativa]|uniref:uncharacterized protein LOC142624969 n=1 Tax=Castanea sativa TaxID=21020 RepID=UPI003F64F2B4